VGQVSVAKTPPAKISGSTIGKTPPAKNQWVNYRKGKNMATGLISKTTVEALKPGEWLFDEEIRGFVARGTSGGFTYGFRYYNAAGRRQYIPLGVHGNTTAEQARKLAKKHAGTASDKTRDPAAEIKAQKLKAAGAGKTIEFLWGNLNEPELDKNPNSFARKHLSTIDSGFDYDRCFHRDLKPSIGALSIYDVKRGAVFKALDAIEGDVMADRALAFIRKFFNWYAIRDEDFRTPLVKGMARIKKPSARARQRTLDDQEIRDMWQALDELDAEHAVPMCYSAFVRSLFYTAQRLRMVSDMDRNEVDGRTWRVPLTRNKRKLVHLVYLSDPVAEIIRGRNSDPFVFSSDGGKLSFKGFSKSKDILDARIAEMRKAAGRPKMPHWTYHDLRRTARTLLAKAGVDKEIGRRVLGQVQGGIDAVYDQYDYWDEKVEALKKLAIMVDRILDPGKKIVAFPKKEARR
jgi:integrase